MKIGYLLQAGVPDIRKTPPTGPVNHVKQVFNNLRSLGHNIRLLAYLDGQFWKSDDLEVFELVHLKWLDSYLFRRFKSAIHRVQYELQLPYAAFFESLCFFQACCQELAECDVLYERMGWMGYGGSLASKRMRIPLVLEVNGDHLSELKLYGIEPHGAQRWLSELLMNRVAHRAAHIIATGKGWQRHFIERWEVDPEKVSVVENGTEVIKLLHREQLRCFCGQDVTDKQVNLIYIGGFEPWHGLNILISAIAKVISQGISLHLYLVGFGSLFGEIKQLVNEFRLNEYITFTGNLTISNMVEFLAKADIGLSPYCGRKEYSGLKLFDYKAAGLAIVASGENGEPSVIEHGRTGLIVPPCNEEKLIDAIIRLISDDEMRKEMGREARIEAENRHSWFHTAIELEKIFKKVIADKF